MKVTIHSRTTVYNHCPSNNSTEWAVEHLTGDTDGNIKKSIFIGLDAKEQAIRWAELEYKNFVFSPLLEHQ